MGPDSIKLYPRTMAPLVARRPAAGYPLLYKEDIYICLCRVYVISYRVPLVCPPYGTLLWGHHLECTLHCIHKATVVSHSIRDRYYKAFCESATHPIPESGIRTEPRPMTVTNWVTFVILPQTPTLSTLLLSLPIQFHIQPPNYKRHATTHTVIVWPDRIADTENRLFPILSPLITTSHPFCKLNINTCNFIFHYNHIISLNTAF